MPKRLAKKILWSVYPDYFLLRHFKPGKASEIEEAIVPAFLSKSAEAIDVGAHGGRYTALMSKYSRWVHAFEPDPLTVAGLRSWCFPNVTIYPDAASSAAGAARYVVPINKSRRAVALGSIEPKTAESEGQVEVTVVKTRPLDDLAGRPVSFIKIDVEGHEREVLAGASALMERARPTILVEVEERHRRGSVREIHEFMSARGYRGFFIRDRAMRPIESFAPEMQNPEELQKNIPRSEMNYVNNFLFIRADAGVDRKTDEVNRRLRQAGTADEAAAPHGGAMN